MLYTDILKKFNDNECTLLTTEKEIEELSKEKFQSHIKVNFITKCNHNNTVVLTNFILRKTGVYCKECIKINNKERTNKLSENNTKEASRFNYMEYTGFCEISKLIENNFIIKKTNEGCKADFIIKPKNNNEISNDCKWLMIQLKTTQKDIHNMYSFNLKNNKYDNMIIICYCIDENKIWIIHYDNISKLKCKLNISKVSKYNKYLTEPNDIIDKLMKYYYTTNLFELDYCLQPINIYQQREIIYIKNRELKLPNIKFEYPDIEQCYYDFIINGKKIQEKVCGIKKNRNSYQVFLYRNRGKKSYKLGMNDFYWFNINNTSIFLYYS